LPDFAPTDDGSNVMYTLHVCPAVSAVPFAQFVPAPLTCAKSAGTLTPVKVTSSVPELVIVASWAAVAASSMSFDPNDSDAGEGDSSV
jgi:hypothetical protein